MVLRTFNFWGFCGPYRDFLYYSRSYQDFQDSRSCQDIPDEIQDPTKKSKMSRQSLEYFQDIQEFKIFLRYSRCRTL